MSANESKPSILFVDDEPNILRALRRLLRSEPYEIRITSDPLEAAELVKTSPPAVIVSDQRMPVMTGVELLEQSRIHAEHTVRILLTGYTDMKAAVEAVNRGGIYSYLTKPWDEQALKTVLRGAVEHHQLRRENERLRSLTLAQNEELKQLNFGLEAKVAQRTRDVRRLNVDLEESFMGGVRLLARISEQQSRVMGSHSKRVAALSVSLGEKIELSRADLKTLEVAATLHDVGAVWTNPGGSLSAIIRNKEHAEHGASMMGMIPNLKEAAVLVRHHHEHFDGSGTPDGLCGTEIPLGARLIAVADAYDFAMNASGKFESATPEASALGLREAAKKGFLDPELVEVLVGLIVGESVDDGLEIELQCHELKIGMILSRDVLSASGAKLMAEGSPIGPRQLGRLQRHLEGAPLSGVHVYRRSDAVRVQGAS